MATFTIRSKTFTFNYTKVTAGMKGSATISSAAFYDRIANVYNAQMNQDPHNQRIRHETALHFTRTIPKGTILDFGGGTGLDLPWLIRQNYRIIFCEPAANMRREAMNFVAQHSSASVTFLNDVEIGQLSGIASESVDGALANFAVFNCIENLTETFSSLAAVLKPGAHVIANVIDTRPYALLTKFPLSYLKSFFRGETTTVSGGKEFVHKTYLHRITEIKKAAASLFVLEYVQPMKGFGFLLIDLKKR